jgi:3-oxoacyl-[acyl-carrier-protein] synthase-1
MAPYSITAYAACTALGCDPMTIVEALSAGRSGLGPAPFDLPMPVTCGAIRTELAPLPEELSRYDTRQARIAWRTLGGIVDAVRNAAARWGSERVGLIIGTSTGGIGSTEEAYAHHREHGCLPHEFHLDHRHGMHATLDVIRARTDIAGPAYVVSTACSSSGKVFGTAERLLDADLVDAVLVGGIDSLCQLTLRGFHALEVLSPAPCRPFSQDRRGINIGEGGALLLLEREGEGVARLLGVGESNDAHHMSAPHPEGAGARAAMEEALQRAHLLPQDVTHVNAHATGTRQNDLAEARAIAAVFGSEVPVVATKGYTGHALGAAGATEAVFSVMAIEHRFLPASLGSEVPDPELPIAVNRDRRPLESGVVLSNSFAFGGNNVAVLLGAPEG